MQNFFFVGGGGGGGERGGKLDALFDMVHVEMASWVKSLKHVGWTFHTAWIILTNIWIRLASFYVIKCIFIQRTE